MSPPNRVRAFASDGTDYRDAFAVFLAHTDQKRQARAWLNQFLQRLPRRRVFLDVGAGNGELTAALGPTFEHSIALEPSPSLRDQLRERCGPLEILAEPIEQATPSQPADLVLCSHVFYYIPQTAWLPTMERLASWTAPGGVAVVALQHHESDGMRLVHHFLGREFNLIGLGRELEQTQNGRYKASWDIVPAQVNTPDLNTAYTICEFFLNTVPMDHPPLRSDVEDYIQKHYLQPGGGYRFSCDQVFLQVRP